MSFSLVGCNSDGSSKVADNTEYYSAITETCTLTKEYEGKSFLTGGIGVATLARATDGDTATFYLVADNTSIALRFHSIDTPESTGSVEKWGQAASLFVKNKLTNAYEIVLEATATPAKRDSYGTRYLGYVWYRNSATDSFKNLNLELVENGYTENKGNDTSEFPYNSYMKKAQTFAKSIQLRIYSKLDDPLYSEDPIETTVKDIVENTSDYFNVDLDWTKESGIGAKVRFTAAIVSLTVSSTQTHTFTAVQYDAETGSVYTINLYAAYSSNAASTMKIGHLYSVVGNLQSYNGTIQISSLKYDTIYGSTNPDVYTTPTQKNYYLTFDSDIDYVSQYSETLYTDVTVVSSSVENNVLTIEGTASRRMKDDGLGDAETYTFTVAVDEDFVNNFTEGKTFSVKGYQFVADSGEVTILNYTDITLSG